LNARADDRASHAEQQDMEKHQHSLTDHRSDGLDQSAELLPLDALRGLDSAIIRAFLSLDKTRREGLLAAYTARHGEAAGVWLSRAALLWSRVPTGKGMGVSRITLARLFALLPERLNQAERLQLAESIWHTARAPTRAVLRVPPGYRNHAVLVALVQDHFHAVLPSVMELPAALRGDVPWLDDPAMQAQHQVLNLLLLAERDQLLTLADKQVEVLFARRLEGMEIRSQFRIAGHELLLRTDPQAQEPALRIRQEAVSLAARAPASNAPQIAFWGAMIGGGLAIAVAALMTFLS